MRTWEVEAPPALNPKPIWEVQMLTKSLLTLQAGARNLVSHVSALELCFPGLQGSLYRGFSFFFWFRVICSGNIGLSMSKQFGLVGGHLFCLLS